MRWLPPILAGDAATRLPLADHSSLALEAALLADTSQARQHHLALLLRRDAALALWTSAIAAIEEGIHPRTAEEAAEWLAGALLAVLARLDPADNAPSDEPVPIDTAAAKRCAQLAAERAAQAEAAARLAAADDVAPPEVVRWAALINDAAAWFPRPRSKRAQTELAARLDQWFAPEPTTARWIDEAQAALVRDDADARACREAVLAEWELRDPATRVRLPLLAARLARLEQLEDAFQQTLEREKLESLRQLAYGAGHEINNPLANIAIRAQTLLKEEHDPERRRRLAAIAAQVQRAHEMIADLMLFARPPQLAPEPLDLVRLVDALVIELRDDAEPRGTRVARVGSDRPVQVLADPVQLGVALRAMCINALEALGSGGAIELEVLPPTDGSAAWAGIIVRDTGPGIAPDVRRHLFDPFYSGREAGRGLGFGLSKCWRIVTGHGGRIDVDTNHAAGAQFTITLPARAG